MVRALKRIVQVVSDGVLNVAEAVTTQVFSAVPAGDNDDVVLQIFPFQHAYDNHARTTFTVVVFYGFIASQKAPGIVGRLGEFFSPAKSLDKSFGFLGRTAWPAGHRVF